MIPITNIPIRKLERLRLLRKQGKLPELDREKRKALRIYRKAVRLCLVLRRSHIEAGGRVTCDRTGTLVRDTGEPYFKITVWEIGTFRPVKRKRLTMKEAFGKKARRETTELIAYYEKQIEERKERRVSRQLKKLAKIVKRKESKRHHRQSNKTERVKRLSRRHKQSRRARRVFRKKGGK